MKRALSRKRDQMVGSHADARAGDSLEGGQFGTRKRDTTAEVFRSSQEDDSWLTSPQRLRARAASLLLQLTTAFVPFCLTHV